MPVTSGRAAATSGPAGWAARILQPCAPLSDPMMPAVGVRRAVMAEADAAMATGHPSPRPGACTGGSRRWLPGLGLVFLKSPPSCTNTGERRWVRTTGISLVRRKKPRMTSSSQTLAHALDLRKPCPEMPWDAWGNVHGGSRQRFPEQHPRPGDSPAQERAPGTASADPSPEKRVEAWRQAIEAAPGSVAGTPPPGSCPAA